MKIMVLSDGVTFSMVDNCMIVEVPEEYSKEDIANELKSRRDNRNYYANDNSDGVFLLANFTEIGTLNVISKDRFKRVVTRVEIG